MHYTIHSTDADLIKGCRQKDRLAQKYLYKRYYGKMLGICMRYTNHKEEAIDVLNRAFLKVFQNLGKYEETGALGGWIARIVFRTAIDYVRSTVKYREVMDYNTERENSIGADAIEQLYAEDIYKLIQELPPTNRAVFSLYVIDGYKHREIAELLKIKLNTSKWHLAEAKKQLRVLLESMNYKV